jgi:16S rRNA (uracil1498-N3)-methyltransferase
MDLALPAQTSRQIAGVLRLKPGDGILLFNGNDSEYTAEITAVRRASVVVRITRCAPGIALLVPSLAVGLALIKHDRFEWALQKLTELGVDRVIPMTTERTVLSFRVDRATQRLARWQRIVTEAAEQSGRARLPEIGPVTALEDLLAGLPDAHTIVLWEDEQAVDLPRLFDDRQTLLLIGPEGGFSAVEVDLARERDCETASLGSLTLRAETAAVAAAAMMLEHRMNQRTD